MEEPSDIRKTRLEQVYLCVEGAGQNGLSAREVAECLKLKVSPQIFDLLEEIIQRGWVRKEKAVLQTGRGLRNGWRYFIIPPES